jgi:autotransporter translocation and assembly factor TamB
VRYRHLRRTVIAVLAAVAFLLLFALVLRAIFEAEPTRRLARRWLEEMATGYGAELEIGDLHWGLLPPRLRLSQVRFRAANVDAEVDSMEVEIASVRLTQRTLELGRVAASGVHLALSGLPRGRGGGPQQLRLRVRQLSLNDVEFQGFDFPGKITFDLDGVRSSWSTQEGTSLGFAEVTSARINIGKMKPLDCTILTRFLIDESGIQFPNYRLDGAGFEFQGHGHVGEGNARFEVGGPLDVGWLDGFVKTHGLLDGSADVAVVIDTQAPALVEADISAQHLVVDRFPLADIEGHLALVDKSLRGSLTRASLFGGSIRGSYVLAEIKDRFPHAVHLEGNGLALQSFLDALRVESAGLAADIDFRADCQWAGRSFPAGNGDASLTLHGSRSGLPVSGALDVALKGEGFLLFDAEDLTIGHTKARWQGALTIGAWQPSWSIAAEHADFSEIGPMVNAWVGSTVLPDGLDGSGQLQVDLSGAFSELTVNARVEAEPLILDPVRFDRLVADATISGSMLRIGSARYQVADGFGEVSGAMNWGEAAARDQIGLEIRGRRIPLATLASWINLDQWVDSGVVSFSGSLGGMITSPTGDWRLNIDDPSLAGFEPGEVSATVALANGEFRTADLGSALGLEGNLHWNVIEREVGGSLSWAQVPLAPLGRELQYLAGDSADVSLDFLLPFGARPTTILRAKSEHATVDIRGEPETVELSGSIENALDVNANLHRDENGYLTGDGTLTVTSASKLLEHLVPDSGVPLSGTADATFTVDWRDEPLPHIEGVLENLEFDLERQPVRLIQPAAFSLSGDGFVVPGLQLRARDDKLFVRWEIDRDGQLRGNVSGTMDTLILRFLLPDWEPAGRATGVVELLGTVEQPQFEGIAEIQKASFRLPGTRTILSQVEGTVFLSSGDVQLEGVDFRLMGGRGRASGRIRERDDAITLALDGTADGVRFEVLSDLEARLSGTWRLIGPVDDLLLSGDITVDRMTLTTKEDVASILLQWLERGSRGPTGGGLNLALRVDAEETIELTNPFVRLTGSAALEVTGTSTKPGLVGQVEVLEGGEATFLGNRYEIERASLNFSDPTAIEPFIDLQATTWIQEYQITVQISGTADHFVTTAVSTPPLSTPDIYSLLGVGTTGRGYGTGAVGLGLASSILSTELTSVLSRRAQLALPVDQVRVDPFAADSTGNPTARLSVIKQITPEWTVILQTTLSGEREQIVVSRWYLAPGLFLEAGQHEDRSLTLDIKLRRPY